MTRLFSRVVALEFALVHSRSIGFVTENCSRKRNCGYQRHHQKPVRKPIEFGDACSKQVKLNYCAIIRSEYTTEQNSRR